MEIGDRVRVVQHTGRTAVVDVCVGQEGVISGFQGIAYLIQFDDPGIHQIIENVDGFPKGYFFFEKEIEKVGVDV